ncbi:hypothetical protein [Flammeovirga pacifica]|nr:hypothetical protein [Flammeovirga pacifica]
MKDFLNELQNALPKGISSITFLSCFLIGMVIGSYVVVRYIILD